MSLEPNELKKQISLLRKAELSMGNENKVVLDDEKENRIKLRKSVVAARDININETISIEMLTIKRPGNGIEPKEIYNIVGKKAIKKIKKDTLLDNNCFS